MKNSQFALFLAKNSFLEHLILSGILLLAAALRFYRLDASSLWSDEGNTWAQLGRSFGQVAQNAAADIHPPGYYWLLKSWSIFVGTDAYAMRSFSVLAGVLTVYLVYRFTLQLNSFIPCTRITAWLAAALAALNPFQVYYSQEARMYMLLALAGAGLFSSLLTILASEREMKRSSMPYLGFFLWAVVGLWTHYSFPIVLLAAGLTYLAHRYHQQLIEKNRSYGLMTYFFIANLAAVSTFLLWLPTALKQIQQWPKGGVAIPWVEGVVTTLQTLLMGPMQPSSTAVHGLWLILTALLALVGWFALSHTTLRIALGLWFGAIIGLMFGLGLFSDAFLKFLLISSPAWCILVAVAPQLLPKAWPLQMMVSAGGLLLAALVLPNYYNNPTTRDNYAGIAQYIQTVGNPQKDLVLLNAPGQQEVWNYYDPGFPVLALPQQRPPDAVQTLAQLDEAVSTRSEIFALFWATDEADPERLVETWLDQHTFKGIESWQNNLRFVTYSRPQGLHCQEFQPPLSFGKQIELLGQCQPASRQQVMGGEIALVGLRWQTQEALAERYKVTLQLLNERGQVVAQRDSEPVGGSLPTDRWLPGIPVTDNHGIFVPPGTPPGHFRLGVALYLPESGQRLPVDAQELIVPDMALLGNISIQPALNNAATALFPIQHRIETWIGPVFLVGVDICPKGYCHEPQRIIHPGDMVHFTFYWQAPKSLHAGWEDDLHFTLSWGEQSLTVPLAGGAYPTGAWQPDQLVRGEFDLLFDGLMEQPAIEISGSPYRLPTVN